MGIVVDGRTADVHRNFSRYLGNKGFFLHSEGIKELYFMHIVNDNTLGRAFGQG